MKPLKLEVIMGNEGWFAQHHCEVCRSTMSSGEWFGSPLKAIEECLVNAEEHARDKHPGVKMADIDGPNPVMKAMFQDMATIFGGGK